MILIVASIIIAIIFRVKININIMPQSSRSASETCPPILLSVEPAKDALILKINKIPTTANRLVADLSAKRPCNAASTPIYISADPSLKYVDFASVVTKLKVAGYSRVYMEPLKRETVQ